MKFSGERFIPNIKLDKELEIEHYQRYLSIKELVRNKEVADIACGEGYGSYILSQKAKRVIGIDIDKKSIDHAQKKYKQKNIIFIKSPAQNIPLKPKSIDMIVSFETIEHLAENDQKTFLQEICRILKSGGQLIMSTPDTKLYSKHIKNYKNEFHLKEFTRNEFYKFLKKYFKFVKFFYQSFETVSLLRSIDDNDIKLLKEINSNIEGKYLIALASNNEGAINNANISSMVLEPEDHDQRISRIIELQDRVKQLADWGKILESKIKEKVLELDQKNKEVNTIYNTWRWKLSTPIAEAVNLIRRENIGSKKLFAGAAVPQKKHILLPSDKLDILYFPIINWDFRIQRPQQLARQFAADNKRIFYFSIDFSRQEDRPRVRQLEDNIYEVILPVSRNISVYKDTLEKRDIDLMLKAIDFLKDTLCFTHTLSVVDLPFWQPLVEKLSYNKTIYDCMDEHSGFSTNTAEMIKIEKKLMQNADLLVLTSNVLYKKYSRHNPNTLLVRNGVEFDHFSKTKKNNKLSAISKKGPIVGYYGAISDWFDNELLEYLAVNRPQYQFVLIGSTFGADIRKLKTLPNVHLLGEKPYAELPDYLYHFSVCTIPFKITPLIEATNPVKFYEYLAAGKKIVTTALPELLEYDGKYVLIAKTKQEFLNNVDLIIKNKDSLAEKKKLIEFAGQHTWAQRYGLVKNAANEKLYPKASIIIVSYNNPELLKNCLNSIKAFTRYPNYEVIVVDNNSEQAVKDYLRVSQKNNPQLKTIFNPKNKGFAAANNQGLKIAEGEYFVLLNNDTVVTQDWLLRLFEHFKDKKTGLIGPVTNFAGNEQKVIDFAAGSAEKINELAQRVYKKYQGQSYTTTDRLGFFCVALTRKIYKKIGGLDEAYGVGMFEDDDYCQRAKKAQYSLRIAQDVFIYHQGRSSFKKIKNKEYKKIFAKNKRYFENKWQKTWTPPCPPKYIKL